MILSVKVDGELVRKGLQNLSDALPKIGRQQFRFMSERVVRRMQAYPGQRPGQRYRRTGRLFYSWRIDNESDRYIIENTAARKGKRYAKYVVGDAYGTSQAWMHRGRWLLFRDVVEEELDKLPPEVLEHVFLVARREGFEVTG